MSSGSQMDPVELVQRLKEQDEFYETLEKNEGKDSGNTEHGSSSSSVPVAADDKQFPQRIADEQLTDDEKVRIKHLRALLDATDEKAINEVKFQLSTVLRRQSQVNDLRKEILYAICDEILEQLKQNFINAATSATPDPETMCQIERHSGNLNWLVSILVDRENAQQFITTWASQSELSHAYFKVAAENRCVISWITATLFAGIGEGKVYGTKNTRYLLLKTWLEPLCEDYLLMGMDKDLIEHGLGGSIFSLPPPMQQELLFLWLDKLMNSGKPCPNLDYWPELWWTNSFANVINRERPTISGSEQ